MFLENVKHIKKIDNGEVCKHILKRINETGYHVETFELSPHQLGVPQQRDRVIFVCIRNDLYDESIQLDMTPPEVPIRYSTVRNKKVNYCEKVRMYRLRDLCSLHFLLSLIHSPNHYHGNKDTNNH